MPDIYTPEEILLRWYQLCYELLFPPHFYERFTPFLKKKFLENRLPELHKAHGKALHELLTACVGCASPEKVEGILRNTPPELVFLYYDRIELLSSTLKEISKSESSTPVTILTPDLKTFYLQLLQKF